MNRRLRGWISRFVPLRLVLPWIFFWKGPRRALAHRYGWARSLRDKVSEDLSRQPLPWISYSAIALLSERLSPRHSVLEFGAGYSTLFFSARVRRVVSLEHDASWAAWVRRRIPENVELVSTQPGPATAYCAPLASVHECFDVIFVDGRHRNEAFAIALDYLSPSGVIFLDDSHRPSYDLAFATAHASGLKHLHLEGHKPMSVDLYRTTLFYRDQNCLGI